MARTAAVKKLRRMLPKETARTQKTSVRRGIRTRVKSNAGKEMYIIEDKPASRGTK